VAVDGAGPINSGERVFGAAIRICHGQERGKVMLLGVAFVVAVTGDLKFPPESSILDDEESVAAREGEELGANAELFKGDFRHHGVAATGGVALPELGSPGEDFDERFVLEADADAGGFGIGGVEGGGEEEGAVGVGEGVEGDAVLGEEGEVGVGGVVEEGGGEEAASGGDEGGGGAEGAFGGDEFVGEEGGEGAREVDGGVSVDVDVVEVGGGAVEEEVPEGGEVEISVGEEEEGDFERGVFGGEVEEFGGVGGGVGIGEGDGAVEEVDVIEFVGGGDWEGVGFRREDSGSEEEEDWEGEEKGEG